MRRGRSRPRRGRGSGRRRRAARARGRPCSLRATLTAANSTSPTSWKRSSRVAGGLELVELAAHRLVGDVVEVEAGRRGAALDLARVQRPGQVLGHLAEDARLAARPRSRLIASQLRSTSPAVLGLDARRRRAGGGGSASAGSARRPRPASRRRAPRAAATGSGPGRGRRRARRAAWRRRPRGRRRRARRPPRPCAGRSSARPARGPTGTRRAGGG